ncbi:MAG: site-2 protease family protein, partial [Bacteroidota bacterium]|nr:site-2 protease family protein [Bacteroidota bacterium]
MLSTVLQFFASLSLLIVLHEFGHFIAARMFGVRVKKFYLFFDFLFPFPNLANFSLFKKKVGDTEYGIGWFPFGGYVQMAGIMDESMDEEELKQPPKPDEFRSKPAWQRLIILLGGIIVNLLLAVIIYTGLSWVYGKDTLPNSALENGYYVDEFGENLGLQNGDIVTKVGDKEVEDAMQVRALLFEDVIDKIEVDRNGERVVLPVTKQFYIDLFDNQEAKPVILEPALLPVVNELMDGPLKQSGGQ